MLKSLIPNKPKVVIPTSLIAPPQMNTEIDYLCLEILEDGYMIFKINEPDNIYQSALYYSYNKEDWEPIVSKPYGEDAPKYYFSQGDIIYLKGNLTNRHSCGTDSIIDFGGSCKFNVSGNILSIVGGKLYKISELEKYDLLQATGATLNEDFIVHNIEDHVIDKIIEEQFDSLEIPKNILKLYLQITSQPLFSWMFSRSKVVSVKNLKLPVWQRENLYFSMFAYCEYLIEPPVLETNLLPGCYANMFTLCKSLEKSPILSAKYVSDHCYYGMFSGCENLKEITMLATSWEDNALDYFTENITSTDGVFIKDKNAELPTGVVPEGWNVINK